MVDDTLNWVLHKEDSELKYETAQSIRNPGMNILRVRAKSKYDSLTTARAYLDEDTKKAMDEYCSEIFMGGQHTLALYNVCEDSLLAAPIILDLLLLTEIFERISYKTEENDSFRRFDNVLSTLGYLCKAPLVTDNCP